MALLMAIISVVCLTLYFYLGARQRAARADAMAQAARDARTDQLIDEIDQLNKLVAETRRRVTIEGKVLR